MCTSRQEYQVMYIKYCDFNLAGKWRILWDKCGTTESVYCLIAQLRVARPTYQCIPRRNTYFAGVAQQWASIIIWWNTPVFRTNNWVVVTGDRVNKFWASNFAVDRIDELWVGHQTDRIVHHGASVDSFVIVRSNGKSKSIVRWTQNMVQLLFWEWNSQENRQG